MGIRCYISLRAFVLAEHVSRYMGNVHGSNLTTEVYELEDSCMVQGPKLSPA